MPWSPPVVIIVIIIVIFIVVMNIITISIVRNKAVNYVFINLQRH